MLDSTQKSIAIATALMPTIPATTATTTTTTKSTITPNTIVDLNSDEIIRNTKHTNLTATPTTTTTTGKTTTKAKTIFSWLKSATKSFDSLETDNLDNSKTDRSSVSIGDRASDSENIPNNDRSVVVVPEDAECRCARAKSPDIVLRDVPTFRGVQSLRHLWNKRISAHEEARYRAFGQSKVHKLTKSIGCLVNATRTGDATATSVEAPPKTLKDTQRAQSLYDCTQLDEETSSLEVKQLTENQHQHQRLQEIDCLHREKDNFYKYKTAEQAAKHLVREAQARSRVKRCTAGIVCGGGVGDDAHFPAVQATERGERIHWLKRQDINVTVSQQRKETESSELAKKQDCAITENCNSVMAIREPITLARTTTTATTTTQAFTVTATTIPDIPATMPKSLSTSRDAYTVISERSADVCQVKTLPTATIVADDQSDSSVDVKAEKQEDENLTNSAADSPQLLQSSNRRTSASSASCTATTTSKRASSDSSSTSSSVTGGRTPRRTSSASARKYSFKTHARSYHQPRKMNTARETNGGSSTSAIGTTGYSMVARLTQQFNEIIQKDRSVLEEVKRKHGVLMARGGHVYKVLETSELSPLPNRSSTVQRTIKKFENSTGEKPEVPAKSQYVLRKHSELVQHLNAVGSKRPLINQAELQLKLDLKRVPPLEAVAEETKSPLDAEDRSMANTHISAINIANDAANVPSVQTITSTYDGGNGIDNIVIIDENDKSANADVAVNIKTHPANAFKHSEGVHVEITEPAESTTQLTVSQLELKTEVATITEESDARLENVISLSPPSIVNIPTSKSTEKNSEMNSTEISGDDILMRNSDTVAVDEATKLKQRKHRYAKIYEKFRFRSPFSKSPEKKSSTTTPATTPNESKPMPIVPPTNITEVTPHIEDVDAEAKLLQTALEAVDRKLRGLSQQPEPVASNVLLENGDVGQVILPNSSFVYQACTAQVSNDEMIVTQAVNVTLVNNIEGEQMIMEQKDLQQQQQQAGIENEHLENKAEPDYTIYEPIVLTPESKTEETQIENTDLVTVISRTSLDSDEIYQTMDEVRQPTATVKSPDYDYESIAGSCEQALPPPSPNTLPPTLNPSIFDGYEICEPPPEEPIVASTPGIPTPQLQSQASVTNTVGRKTNDKLPELPKPKRRLPKSPMPGKRPPKPPALVLDNTEHHAPKNLPPNMLELLDDDDEHHYYADDENIYDTIKGSHCYESLHSAECVKLSKSSSGSGKGSDSVSLTSNCYESISHYRRVVINGNGGSGQIAGSSSGSTLTISSDHKTNSLYEMSSTATGLLYGTGSFGYVGLVNTTRLNGHHPGSSARSCVNGVSSSSASGSGSDGGRNYCHSRRSSDNSDAWTDVSDTEADADASTNGERIPKTQFIVVRERFKAHRSPDWSKRIRDKRLQQKVAMSCIEDDSDHYYESLSPLGNKRHSLAQPVQRSNSHHKRNQDLPRYVLASRKQSITKPIPAHGISDDYDSFDTDTDEVYETEEQMKNHNDSGVDIRNVKLPEPPSSTNQVYAIVRKFKNFISNKKSPSNKHGGSQQKLYENSSQFYVENNVYQYTPKPKAKSGKFAKKQATNHTPTQQRSQDNIYENTEFHTTPNIIDTLGRQHQQHQHQQQQQQQQQQQHQQQQQQQQQLSASDKNLSVHGSSTEVLNNTAPTLRSKSKASKSFKSRLRKSLGGAAFDSKQLSTLTPTRSTFYIEDPSHGGSGELDSGFSEKASSGDLPVAMSGPSAPSVTSTPTAETQKFSTVARKAKKEAKAANAQRRRTTIGIRPQEPPPPPPPHSEEATLRIKPPQQLSTTTSTTSWYAECGVFKHGAGGHNGYSHDEHSLNGSKSTHSHSGSMTTLTSTALNGNSWYAEAGLYQTSGISVASSSGSSGVSTGNEAGIGDDLPHSMFLNEPLYQIYSAEKLESISRDMEDLDGSTDGYEEVGQIRSSILITAETQKRSRPSALQLVGPKNGPSRTLWSEIPEVINSCILPTLTPRERGLQEAKFEIITSEASYLKSLNLLRSHFMNHPLFRDTSLVSARDRKALFAYIVPVHECSERLLTELESCWQDNIMLLGLSKRIYAVAEKNFSVYIAFCEHQGRMDRTLRRLKEAKGAFSQNLDLLEASANCCGLNLHSFLMLPMQRITRLPLLIDAVFSKVSPQDDEYDSWKMTLAIMNKIVTQCNEAANRCEQAYEIERISRQLEFPAHVRALAIAPVGVPAVGSKPRFLVKKGELTHLVWRGDDAKLTFGKKFAKSSIYAFLFSDLLVLTKRKAEELFQVFDYCPRNMLTITSGDALPQLPTKDMGQTGKNLMLMTLLENHERKTVEFVLSCPSVSEQERWLQATRPPEPETPGEKLYEQWDCPQVIAKHTYEAKEPDVLNLEVGDVVNVSRKLPDGWYQGERIRDGAVGWFPGTFTEEVNSAHVRARNLKQRHRLLTFTATYLESQSQKRK